MDVSVILASWNNRQRLKKTLDAFCRLRDPDGFTWQLVLVDNNSTDGTGIVVREYESQLPLIYVQEPVQGLSRARNAGIQNAEGDLLVFSDDDITPNASWLANYWNAFCEYGDRFFFGGPIEVEYEGERPDDALMELAPTSVAGVSFGDIPRTLSSSEHFLEANWACPANAIRTAGGFDEQLGLDATLSKARVGEGFELQDRLREGNCQGWYLPTNSVVHHPPATKCELPHIANRAEAHGQFISYLMQDISIVKAPPNLKSYCRERGVGREAFLVDLETSGPRLLGVPWRLFPRCLSFWLTWRVLQLAGMDGRKSYVRMRFCSGAIRGFREGVSQRAKRLGET